MSFMKALAEYCSIVKGFAEEYENDVSIEIIRSDHPELDFMDSDEIFEILDHAKKCRNRLKSR